MGMMERWAFPTIFLLNGFMLAQAQPSAVEGKINPSVVQEGLQSTIPLQVAISAFGAVSITNIHRGEWLSGALKRSASLKPQEEAVRAQRVILDALIKTHTAVPLTDLLPFFDRAFPPPSSQLSLKIIPEEARMRCLFFRRRSKLRTPPIGTPLHRSLTKGCLFPPCFSRPGSTMPLRLWIRILSPPRNMEEFRAALRRAFLAEWVARVPRLTGPKRLSITSK